MILNVIGLEGPLLVMALRIILLFSPLTAAMFRTSKGNYSWLQLPIWGQNSVRQSLTESVEVLIGGGEGVILVKGADFGGALVSCCYWPHLSLLGGAAGSLLLLLCQLPVVVRSQHTQTGDNRHVNNILDEITDIWPHTGPKQNVMMITDQQKRCTSNDLNEGTPTRTATAWLVFREEPWVKQCINVCVAFIIQIWVLTYYTVIN